MVFDCFPFSHPLLIYQQAVNEPSGSVVSQDVKIMLSTGVVGEDAHIMEWLNKRDSGAECLMTMPNLPSTVTCLTVSMDGNYLACGSDDCVVRLYNISTAKVKLKEYLT